MGRSMGDSLMMLVDLGRPGPVWVAASPRLGSWVVLRVDEGTSSKHAAFILSLLLTVSD